MGHGATWFSVKHLCPLQGNWPRMIFEAPFNPNLSMNIKDKKTTKYSIKKFLSLVLAPNPVT